MATLTKRNPYYTMLDRIYDGKALQHTASLRTDAIYTDNHV